MRAGLIVLLFAATAHADPVATLKKRGYTDVTRVAKGKVSVIVARDPQSTLHTFLVDGKGRIADAGEASGMRGLVTVQVSKFLGKKSLYDVDVAWHWSNGMGVDDGDTHFIVRAAKFTFACSFEGDTSSGMEDSSSSATHTLKKTGDSPLTWTITWHATSSHHTDLDTGNGDPREQVTTYTLGSKGQCESQSSSLR